MQYFGLAVIVPLLQVTAINTTATVSEASVTAALASVNILSVVASALSTAFSAIPIIGSIIAGILG
jgi:hypothetical protein